MKDYKKIPTSPEVWAVIRARHPEMCVFRSYSAAPGGDIFGDKNNGRMLTSYGFKGGDYPVIEAQTTWEVNKEAPHERVNEQHEYWLCLPIYNPSE